MNMLIQQQRIKTRQPTTWPNPNVLQLVQDSQERLIYMATKVIQVSYLYWPCIFYLQYRGETNLKNEKGQDKQISLHHQNRFKQRQYFEVNVQFLCLDDTRR